MSAFFDWKRHLIAIKLISGIIGRFPLKEFESNGRTTEKAESQDTRKPGHPDTYYEVTLWENVVKLICDHMEETLYCIQHTCTDEELLWLGEIHKNTMAKTRI